MRGEGTEKGEEGRAEGKEKGGDRGGRREGRGLSGNVAEEAFCLKSAPAKLGVGGNDLTAALHDL